MSRWKRELAMLAAAALKDLQHDRTEEYTAGVLTERVEKDLANKTRQRSERKTSGSGNCRTAETRQPWKEIRNNILHTIHSRKCDVLVLLKMLLIPLVYEQK
jgi:hypothetical protein